MTHRCWGDWGDWEESADGPVESGTHPEAAKERKV